MKGLLTEVRIATISQREKFAEKGRWCDFCNKPRHTKEACWKLHAKTSNWKGKKPAEEPKECKH